MLQLNCGSTSPHHQTSDQAHNVTSALHNSVYHHLVNTPLVTIVQKAQVHSTDRGRHKRGRDTNYVGLP